MKKLLILLLLSVFIFSGQNSHLLGQGKSGEFRKEMDKAMKQAQQEIAEQKEQEKKTQEQEKQTEENETDKQDEEDTYQGSRVIINDNSDKNHTEQKDETEERDEREKIEKRETREKREDNSEDNSEDNTSQETKNNAQTGNYIERENTQQQFLSDQERYEIREIFFKVMKKYLVKSDDVEDFKKRMNAIVNVVDKVRNKSSLNNIQKAKLDVMYNISYQTRDLLFKKINNN